MSCYSPLLGIPNGKTVNNKTNYKIMTREESRSWLALKRKSFLPSHLDGYIEIPCGKCIGCRLAYSRSWADRMMLELQDHESSFFVTLTYDDLHIPTSDFPNPDGEVKQSFTLKKRDFQLFMKRLRDYYSGQKIRFYASGEYGSNTHRPHYHAILFGLKLDDLIPFGRSSKGFSYYRSPSLEKLWPFGFVMVCDVSWDTCAYVARYVTKKLNGDMADFYSRLNIEKEFSLMSRKPGIGRNYYDTHPDIFKYKYINVSTRDGGREIKPSRYYEKLFELDQPDLFKVYKANKMKSASAHFNLETDLSSLNYPQLLSVKQDVKEKRIKSLRRNSI